jgi:small subunit ribosomal protein S19
MPRSKWKLPHIDCDLLNVMADHQRSIDDLSLLDPSKSSKSKTKGKALKITTNSRSTLITDSFCGLFFQVHNGNKYITVKITKDHVGHKLGEFSHTRKILKHKEVKKKATVKK